VKPSDISGIKNRRYLKGKFARNSKDKNIRDMYSGTNEFKRG
jgi:hypothetical protein